MKTSDEIADDLRSRILGGEFVGGSTLPELAALEREYRADHPTVRRALHALEREGVIHLTLVAIVSAPPSDSSGT